MTDEKPRKKVKRSRVFSLPRSVEKTLAEETARVSVSALPSVRECPFCGHVPMTFPRDDEEASRRGTAFGVVSCVNPQCAAKPTVEDGEQAADDRGWREYVRAAIERWNRRA